MLRSTVTMHHKVLILENLSKLIYLLIIIILYYCTELLEDIPTPQTFLSDLLTAVVTKPS